MFQPVLIWLILPFCIAQDDSASGWSRDMPEALRKALDYRSKPRTGYAKFKVKSRVGYAPIVEARYEQRFAGNNVVSRYAYGEGRDDRELFLAEDGLTVNCINNPPSVYGSKASSPLTPDIRTLGLIPGLFSSMNLTDCINMLTVQGKREYRWRMAGDGKIHVEGRNNKESGATDEINWIIDPSRDFSIVHIARTLNSPPYGEKTYYESKIEIGQFDGFWWPRRVTAQRDSTKLAVDVDVLELEFNRAAHPQKIGVDQLELPIGMLVNITMSKCEDWGWHELQTFEYTGDNNLVPKGEPHRIKVSNYNIPRLIDSGQFTRTADGNLHIEVTPTMVNSDGKMGPYPPESRSTIAGNPDEWEIYVRRWIARYSGEGPTPVKVPLDEKQKAAAMAILEDCRKQARPLVERRKAERIEAEKTFNARNAAVLAASRGDAKPPSALVQDFQAAQKRVSALQQPDPQVEAIFESLKMRLNGLPTAKQRMPGR
ncbi:hypothetical protein RAS2_31750 [Phycisphaerae bacterium RAS2]|nr:hypothetical protein RAS2_31750 [Phycisphaerae bacterium RAS2]